MQTLKNRLLRLVLPALAGLMPAWSLAQSSMPSARPGKPLNVIVIVADDLNTALGCYGNAVVKTPNIDRLAQRGVRFERAYCQFPVCNPSRASMLSGLLPETINIMGQASVFMPGPAEPPFYPRFFRQNGYLTGHFGKLFHGSHTASDADLARRATDDPGAWDIAFDIDRAAKINSPNAALIKAHAAEGKGELRQWKALEVPDEGVFDGQAARRAAATLRQQAGQNKPLFLALGFHKPHLPWYIPKRYFDLYKPEQMVIPPGMTPEQFKKIPTIALNDSINDLPGPEEARQSIAAYYACISYVDAQIGLLLGAVDELKMWDNTVIMMIGDNGYHLGDNGIWGKRTLFEESARVPLIIAAPNLPRAGSVCARPVEMLDVYPTLADLCGLKPPPGLQGKSLKPLLDNPQAPWDRPAYTVVLKDKVMGRTIRTERHRYTEWDGGKLGVELYDYVTDPLGRQNLAADPAHAATLAQLKQLLADRQASATKRTAQNVAKAYVPIRKDKKPIGGKTRPKANSPLGLGRFLASRYLAPAAALTLLVGLAAVLAFPGPRAWLRQKLFSGGSSNA